MKRTLICLLLILPSIAFTNEDIEIPLLAGYELRSNDLSDTGNGYLMRDIDIVYREEPEKVFEHYKNASYLGDCDIDEEWEQPYIYCQKIENENIRPKGHVFKVTWHPSGVYVYVSYFVDK